MNWTTVDQLPTPIKEVIVAHENGGVGIAVHVPKYHLPDDEVDEFIGDFNEEDGEYYASEGWYSVDEENLLHTIDSPVTHWMPLPTHPNKQTATPTGEDVG